MKEKNHSKSYRPYASLFGFFVGLGSFTFSCYFWYGIAADKVYFNLFNLAVYLFTTLMGVLSACWTGSFIKARITISGERLIIDHAAKMPSKAKHIHLWQLGCYHIDLRWDEIKELRADINWMRIILLNGDCYTFPIGWCNDKARIDISHHKHILPWE